MKTKLDEIRDRIQQSTAHVDYNPADIAKILDILSDLVDEIYAREGKVANLKDK